MAKILRFVHTTSWSVGVVFLTAALTFILEGLYQRNPIYALPVSAMLFGVWSSLRLLRLTEGGHA